MISYASVDRIEQDYAVCEVEFVDVNDSDRIEFTEKETEMIDIPLDVATGEVGTIDEGDILVVEHDGTSILWIYCKDDEEKRRRMEALKSLMEKL